MAVSEHGLPGSLGQETLGRPEATSRVWEYFRELCH